MLASAKLQHDGGNSKFCANLWRFEMLKSAHIPSVYWGKIIFLYRESVQVWKCHLTQIFCLGFFKKTRKVFLCTFTGKMWVAETTYFLF